MEYVVSVEILQPAYPGETHRVEFATRGTLSDAEHLLVDPQVVLSDGKFQRGQLVVARDNADGHRVAAFAVVRRGSRPGPLRVELASERTIPQPAVLLDGVPAETQSDWLKKHRRDWWTVGRGGAEMMLWCDILRVPVELRARVLLAGARRCFARERGNAWLEEVLERLQRLAEQGSSARLRADTKPLVESLREIGNKTVPQGVVDPDGVPSGLWHVAFACANAVIDEGAMAVAVGRIEQELRVVESLQEPAAARVGGELVRGEVRLAEVLFAVALHAWAETSD